MTGAPILLMIATGPVAGVGPDFGAVTGSRLYPIIGAVVTIALVLAVAMFVICAFVGSVRFSV